MNSVDIDALRKAVKHTHGGKAMPVESVLVKETFKGDTGWEGVVHVFDITGHPEANRAQAWSEPIDGNDKRRFFAVLHIPPVDSPLAAVKASIVERFRHTA